MNRHDSLFIKGLTLFGGLTSFGFVYYAVSVLAAAHAPEWDRVFAYVAAGYGLGNIYILSAAWRTGAPWIPWANKLIAFCFFGVFLLERWNAGVESALEIVGVLAVAGVLWLNWFAVKTVAQRDGSGEDTAGASSGGGKAPRKKGSHRK